MEAIHVCSYVKEGHQLHDAIDEVLIYLKGLGYHIPPALRSAPDSGKLEFRLSSKDVSRVLLHDWKHLTKVYASSDND